MDNQEINSVSTGKTKKGLIVTSLILGIVSLVFCIFFGGGLIFAIVGLILAIIAVSKKYEPKKKAKTSLIINIIGLALGLISLIAEIVIIIVFAANNPETLHSNNSYNSTTDYYYDYEDYDFEDFDIDDYLDEIDDSYND